MILIVVVEVIIITVMLYMYVYTYTLVRINLIVVITSVIMNIILEPPGHLPARPADDSCAGYTINSTTYV